jgi:fructokinase
MAPIIIAAVEGGGTSFVVAVAEVVSGETTPKVLFRSEVDSSHDNPTKTLQECATFFQKHKPDQGYHALGIASFGPVGLVKSRPTYGCILSTSPKKSWRDVDLITPLTEACQGSRPLSVKIDTDVNAPAFAEYMLVKDTLSSVAYITVGTGIGVGMVIHGQPVHGRMHPEGGTNIKESSHYFCVPIVWRPFSCNSYLLFAE